MVSECHSIERMVDAGRQIGDYPIRQYKLRRWTFAWHHLRTQFPARPKIVDARQSNPGRLRQRSSKRRSKRITVVDCQSPPRGVGMARLVSSPRDRSTGSSDAQPSRRPPLRRVCASESLIIALKIPWTNQTFKFAGAKMPDMRNAVGWNETTERWGAMMGSIGRNAPTVSVRSRRFWRLRSSAPPRLSIFHPAKAFRNRLCVTRPIDW
jgi:hypothetical protein